MFRKKTDSQSPRVMTDHTENISHSFRTPYIHLWFYRFRKKYSKSPEKEKQLFCLFFCIQIQSNIKLKETYAGSGVFSRNVTTYKATCISVTYRQGAKGRELCQQIEKNEIIEVVERKRKGCVKRWVNVGKDKRNDVRRNETITAPKEEWSFFGKQNTSLLFTAVWYMLQKM